MSFILKVSEQPPPVLRGPADSPPTSVESGGAAPLRVPSERSRLALPGGQVELDL